MKRAIVRTLGCKVNQYDGDVIGGLLLRDGWMLVERGPADLVVVNTCTVTAKADSDARRQLRRARRDNPEALVVVTGCLAERDSDSLRALPEVDVVVDNAGKGRLPRVVRDRLAGTALEGASRRASIARPFSGPVPGPELGRARAFLKIQEGCEQHCAYCIVPSVRGRMRSRSIAEVLGEIGRLVEAGYSEVVLCGVHLGAFGRERGEHLADLIPAIDGLDGLFRVRLSSVEPWSVDARLLGAVGASRRTVPHLHVPLQSGCDATLRRMGRPYSADGFARLINAARAAVPGLTIGTDVMVGFPGEDEGEFEASLGFLEDQSIDLAHVFSYSPRPGTRAAESSPPAPQIVKARLHRVRGLFDARRREWLQRHVDRVVEVVTLDVVDGGTRALAATYAPVRLTQRLDRGRLVPARVNRVDGAGLVGEPAGEERPYNGADDSALGRTAVEGCDVGP